MTVVDTHTGAGIETPRDAHRMIALPGGCKKGQLTSLGHLQAFGLGRYLQERYGAQTDVLPSAYDPARLEGRTTNIHRTRDSIHDVLTGLYPAHDGRFEVRSCSGVDEVLVANVHNCDRLASLYKAARGHVKQQAQRDAEAGGIAARVRTALQLPQADDGQRISWTELHDALTAMRAHGKAMPPALTEQDLADINRQATAQMMRLVGNEAYDDILKLSMGRLLHIMGERFVAAVAGDGGGSGSAGRTSPQLLLWSGHDTTIMPVLLALGQDVTEWPPYMSQVVFELWEAPAGADGAAAREDSHLVRLLYNDAELSVPGVPEGRPMTLAEFRALVLAVYSLSEAEHGTACRFSHDTSTPGIDTTSY